MVIFFVIVLACVVIGYCKWAKDSTCECTILVASGVIGIVLGLGASFWGGSFVKKEIIVEKYFISLMIFDGKPIAALMEEHDNLSFENNNYIFQVGEGEELKLIKHYFKKEDIFFSLNEDEERYLKIKSRRTCKRRMWIWFFYGNTGIVKSEAMFKKGDSFLTLPRYYSL